MKRVILASIFAMTLSPGANAQGVKWTCTAPRLAEFDYRGGKTATIRLEQYSRGGEYLVTKSADGNTATGKTGDGTTFVCTNPAAT